MTRCAIYVTCVVLLWQHALAFKKNPGSGVSVGSFSDCAEDLSFELTWNDTGTILEFTMKYTITTLNPTGNWIAFALSDDQGMGSDNVFDCITDGNSTFVQRSQNIEDNNEPLPKMESWMTDTDGSYVNGVLMCSFSVYIDNATNVNFTTDWYVFFGNGRYSGGYKQQHDFLPKITDTEVDFQSNTNLCAPGSQTVRSGAATISSGTSILIISFWILHVIVCIRSEGLKWTPDVNNELNTY